MRGLLPGLLTLPIAVAVYWGWRLLRPKTVPNITLIWVWTMAALIGSIFPAMLLLAVARRFGFWPFGR